MAEVELVIGGHHYGLTCANGEEAALLRLGTLVDQQVQAAKTAIGGLSETRQLLFAALFLADQLESGQQEHRSASARSGTMHDDATATAKAQKQTERIERVNQRLEENLRVITSSLS